MTEDQARRQILRRIYELRDVPEYRILDELKKLDFDDVTLSRHLVSLKDEYYIKAEFHWPSDTSRRFIDAAMISITKKGSDLIESSSHRDTQMTDGRPTRKSHCISCNRETNHLELHAEITESWEDVGEQGQMGGGGTYSTLQCRGCGSVTFLSETWFSEDADPEDGTYNITVHQWPPTPKYGRPRPSWMWGLSLSVPLEVANFLAEIYSALDNENLRLCALGIRALIEQVMISQVGEQGSLGKNVDAFFTAGHVASRDQRSFRSAIIGVGDAAMHRGYTPKVEDIHALLDITETLIASIFVHPELAREVGARIPPRSGRPEA
jgi:hypothetical protein